MAKLPIFSRNLPKNMSSYMNNFHSSHPRTRMKTVSNIPYIAIQQYINCQFGSRAVLKKMIVKKTQQRAWVKISINWPENFENII
jgi:hypothetical protein